MDFIENGQAQGDVATRLMLNNMDPRCLRPWHENGRSWVVNQQGLTVPTANATTLRKDDWKILDDAVVKAAKQRLRAVADLRSANLTFGIANGMGKTVLETETQSDINEAVISMDGLRESQHDRPEFNLVNLPLPIIHKDFHFSARQLSASRNGGSPLDTTTAELSARRVAEQAEQLLLGVSSSYTYGGGTIYGYKNFPNRLTKTLTAPTASGWTPATLVQEVLEMRLQSQQAFHYGPWKLYNSPNWDVYMDDDYSSAKGDLTLRDRLEKIGGISSVDTSDYLTSFDLIMVQMTSDVVREVQGMPLTTVQWESKGGLQLNFKVMMISVPQLRSDFNDNTGIVHGSV